MEKTNSELPLLGISMKPCHPFPGDKQSFEDICEGLAAMRSQEVSYRCKDYLYSRRELLSKGDPDDRVDVGCREKMCEWCYRVCDCGQFPSNREVVAFGFSYLDRFLESTICDRATFKLASVTSFYIAFKIMNRSQISIRSLVDLGRGEFDRQDIQTMEKIILAKLEWKMNPPIPQSFVRQLHFLFLASVSHDLAQAVYERATFFTELSVYDYCFVTKECYLIAVASVLNAVEALDDEYQVSSEDRSSLDVLEVSLRIDLDRNLLEKAQARLWYLFSCSAQVSNCNIVPLHYSGKHARRLHKETESCPESSPVSVRLRHVEHAGV